MNAETKLSFAQRDTYKLALKKHNERRDRQMAKLKEQLRVQWAMKKLELPQ